MVEMFEPYLYSARRLGRSKSMIALCLVLFVAQLVAAQQNLPASGDSQQEINKALLQKIDLLESRVKELEAKQRMIAEPGPPPTPEIQVERVTKNVPSGASTVSGNIHESMGPEEPRLRIRGFTDVAWHASDRKGETNSFALGQFNLFIKSSISRRLDMLAELVIEADENNAVGVDLERMLFRYSANDYFRLSMGRYHTAIGYYSTAYHHSAWLQTATGRPFIFAFEDEGGILPIHNVGVSAEGRIPSGKFGLHYVAELGNGRTSRSKLAEAVQNKVDENNGKAVNIAVFARPEAVRGLQVGFSFYHDNLTPDGLPNIRQSIVAAHVVYQTSRFEFLNEGILIRHALVGSPTVFNTPAFYTQISRSIGRFRPYFRYQYVNVSETEPIFGDVGRQNGPSFGLRYDLGEFSALKIQYDRTGNRQSNSSNGITTQLSFTF